MDLIVTQQKLRNGLRTVERIISRNVSLPILNTILLRTENNQLKLAATNLEVGINYWLSAKINQTGAIAVPARIFSDFISNINDEKITLRVDKNVVHINSEHYQTQILGADPKDFPLIPKNQGNSEIKINSYDLNRALTSVVEATALSETRPEISGVFLNILKNRIEFAATDSFRLAENIVGLNSGVEKTLILPKNTVIEMIRFSADRDGDLTISLSDNQIFIKGEDFDFVSRLIDGHYPDYKKVIPEKAIALASVNKAELERNIRLASIFASNIFDIKLSGDENRLELVAQNSDRGEIKTHIPCAIKNGPFAVSVNYRYLLDGLKTIPAENVIIQFTGEGSPLVIKGEEIKNQTYLIMPLRSWTIQLAIIWKTLNRGC